MNELEILRATCKTLPQQYQAYLVIMGESHKTTIFEDFLEGVFVYKNNSAYLNSLRNNQQYTSMEDTNETLSSMGGEAKEALHQEDRKSLPSNFEKGE